MFPQSVYFPCECRKWNIKVNLSLESDYCTYFSSLYEINILKETFGIQKSCFKWPKQRKSRKEKSKLCRLNLSFIHNDFVVLFTLAESLNSADSVSIFTFELSKSYYVKVTSNLVIFAFQVGNFVHKTALVKTKATVISKQKSVALSGDFLQCGGWRKIWAKLVKKWPK